MAYQNFYATKTGTAIGAADTTITVQTPPSVTSGRLVLEPRNSSKREIISFTGVSGTSLTGVTRGLYGTSATTHASGSLVEMNFLAQDYQDLVDSFNTFAASNSSWWTGLPAVSSVTYNGQRSYDITFVSTVASLLSPGMRLRTTRTVSAPTQCTSLNGTNQYYSKTSPSGMTFTDDFVVSAWVKLDRYPSSEGIIVGRYNGTNGWEIRVEQSGIIRVVGYNGSASNASWVVSYQSLPLNRWVHIAAQLDMSAFTASTTTSYIMLDGVDIPVSVARAGTNPTALIQAGNLEIGSKNGGTSPFPGKIAQVAIFNAKVTQATMRGYMSQGILGTETSLISAYSFSNSINDLNTTNANNLTANGSAVATDADSPFGGQAGGTISSTLDYGIVQKVTASTLTVQVAEGCTIPTSGGVASASYSTYKSPYGFPGQRGKWIIESILCAQNSQTTPTSGTWYNVGSWRLQLPLGDWDVEYSAEIYGNRASGSNDIALTLALSAATQDDKRWTARVSTNAVADVAGYVQRRNPMQITSSLTSLYLNLRTNASGMNAIYVLGDSEVAVARAENAYL